MKDNECYTIYMVSYVHVVPANPPSHGDYTCFLITFVWNKLHNYIHIHTT